MIKLPQIPIVNRKANWLFFLKKEKLICYFLCFFGVGENAIP